MLLLNRLFKYAAWWALSGFCCFLLIISSAFLYLSPKLPSKESYTNIRLQNPLRIFSVDNKLIAEFGDRRSNPIKYEEVPPLVINALISSEDRRFYEHNGVDLKGLLRSVAGIVSGNDWGGGSTITMQVTKNFFFEGESAYSRKFKEILLAIKMERELSKEEILELYLNRTFFGISAYGIAAAAKQYYDKDVDELTLAEIATTIGILPRPNAYNPLESPQLAMAERGRVLRRMRDQGMIDQTQYQSALESPITARRYGRQPELEAPYIAEMVRLEMVERYGDLATTDGFEVYTTIDSRMQSIANQALEKGLENYDRKHGYRGRENHHEPKGENYREQWLSILRRTPTVGNQIPGFVEKVEDKAISVLLESGENIHIDWQGLRWAKRYINQDAWGSSPKSAGEVVSVGDLIRVYRHEDARWSLGQIPEVNGGLVAIDPNNGAIRALVGGYDYSSSKFNRITQAVRQPGSNFKPFLYAAALENGFTAASLINDAPLPRSDYRPENFNKEFLGPMRLKYALTNSKNLVSIRLYNALGDDVVLPYAGRFGFQEEEFPTNDLSVAIGSHALHPIEMAEAYTVFANGGYKVEPFLINRIDNFNDGEMFRASPLSVCECNTQNSGSSVSSSLETSAPPLEQTQQQAAPRVIDERVAYIMNTILHSVITDGSGKPANRAMRRGDIAGKTGTSNDAKDLWFSGFNGNMVATVYVGFDEYRSLGRSEQAATVSLPIWIDFMKEVLEGTPERSMAQPDGLVTVRIDQKTGLRARPDQEGTIFEIFRKEYVPDYPSEAEVKELGTKGDQSPPADKIF